MRGVADLPLVPQMGPLGEAYDRPACDRFVAGLGDEVLQRGRVFFRYLAEEGEVDSVRLAGRLGAAPGEVAGLLITPLSRRAEAIGAPPPFVEERAPRTRRRVWRDQGGIAERLGATIEVEIARRSPGDAAPPEDDR